MRAFVLTTAGATPALGDMEEPAPGPGQVLIEVAACALNFADLLMADGTYQDIPEPPFALGMEVAGTVAALGPGTNGPAPGTPVMSFCGSGGLAERVAVDSSRVVPLPPGIEPAVAAALPIAYGTSHLALAERARLAEGETLVVLGAGGGVGLTAVEIGRRLGARVVAVARGEAKLEAARRAGAHEALEPSGDIAARLKSTGGADVLYDPVGGELAEGAARALRPLGRHLVIGFAAGRPPAIKPNVALVKNVDVIGFYWGGYMTFAPGRLRRSLERIIDWAAAGAIAPHIGLRLPLERAEEGLQALKARRVAGKVVVEVRPA